MAIFCCIHTLAIVLNAECVLILLLRFSISSADIVRHSCRAYLPDAG